MSNEDFGSKKITSLRQQTPDQEADILQKRIDSILRDTLTHAASMPVTPPRIAAIKPTLLGYEVTALESILLNRPGSWKGSEADTAYWIAVAERLKEKYQERDRLQTGRE